MAALSFEGEESPNSEGECIPITSERRFLRPVRIRATETSSSHLGEVKRGNLYTS